MGNDPTGAVHCYDAATNSWSVVGEMMIPRYCVLAAVLPGSHQLVVVGGMVRECWPIESTRVFLYQKWGPGELQPNKNVCCFYLRHKRPHYIESVEAGHPSEADCRHMTKYESSDPKLQQLIGSFLKVFCSHQPPQGMYRCLQLLGPCDKWT